MKTISEYIHKLFQKKSTFLFLIVGAIFIFLYWLLKHNAASFDFYQALQKGYAYFVGKGFEIMAALAGKEVEYHTQLQQISYGDINVGVLSKLALKFQFMVLAILFVFPRQWFKTILMFMGAAVGLYLLSVVRFFVDISTLEQIYYLYMPIIYTGRYLIVFLVLYYKINLHQYSQDLFQKADVKIRQKFQFSLKTLLLMLVFATGVIAIVDWFVIVQSNTLIRVLSQWILGYSEILLRLMGYHAVIEGYQINLGLNWVYLGTPCLGVGVMTLFAALIIIVRGHWLNKLIYIVIGVNILIFANSIRVIAILLHIYLNQIPAKLIEDYHGMSNNFFYILVLLMVFAYNLWFVNINFRKHKKQIDSTLEDN